jgi:hypothetical protein
MIPRRQTARLVFCFLLTLALASCAAEQEENHRAPRTIASAKPIHTILLVSLIPNKIAMQYGESIYARPPKTEYVRWDINGRALDVLRNYLSPAYSVSTSDITAESTAPIDFNAGFDQLQQLLKDNVEPGKHDLILVIAPISPSGTNASLLFAPGQTYQVAFTYILVALDGNDFGVTGVGYAPNDYFARIRRLRWHGRTFVDMNEVDKRIVERTVNGLIDRNIPRSLETLGLKGNTPPL